MLARIIVMFAMIGASTATAFPQPGALAQNIKVRQALSTSALPSPTSLTGTGAGTGVGTGSGNGTNNASGSGSGIGGSNSQGTIGTKNGAGSSNKVIAAGAAAFAGVAGVMALL